MPLHTIDVGMYREAANPELQSSFHPETPKEAGRGDIGQGLATTSSSRYFQRSQAKQATMQVPPVNCPPTPAHRETASSRFGRARLWKGKDTFGSTGCHVTGHRRLPFENDKIRLPRRQTSHEFRSCKRADEVWGSVA